jgi:hypothetical protein
MIIDSWKILTVIHQSISSLCLSLIYLNFLISHFFTNLSHLFHPLPLSGIVLGGQRTAMRRRCAPRRSRHTMARHKSQAQPPHDGALPAHC